MRITINEKEFEYISDFDKGWVFSKGDYFKVTQIDKHTCFIKRFEAKNPGNISGWELMEKLKGKNESNLARLHDIAATKEKGKNVYYVFYEFIEGETLHTLISRNEEVNLGRLTEDLFVAIRALQAKHFWFADFTEKNIFCDTKGKFVLIDLDSAQPASTMPNNEMWGDKEYWVLVFNFYRQILHKHQLIPSDINGVSLNYLHIVFLILRLKTGYSGKEKKYYTQELFEHLPAYLNDIAPAFKKIFNKLLQSNEPEPEDIREIKDLIGEKIIKTSPSPRPPEPVIHEFTISGYAEKIEDDYAIETGKTFTLNWEVQHALHAELYKNGKLYEKLDIAKKSINLQATFNDQEKKIEYTLSVFNDPAEKKYKSVTIIPKLNPVITEFTIKNYIKKDGDNYVVENGKTFTLIWDVQNVLNVELYKNGEPYKKFNTDKKNTEFNEKIYDSEEGKIEYMLLASNGPASVKSHPLHIKIIHLTPVIKEFAINNYIKKDGDNYVVENAKTFTLIWDVKNAVDLELYKNGQPHKKLSNAEKNIKLAEEIYDGKEKEVEYMLLASNGAASVKSSALHIKIIHLTPVIKEFAINNYVERDEDKYAIESGKTFTLIWDVENAVNLELYKNGQPYRKLSNTEKNIKLAEEAYDGIEKEIEYTLHASGGSGTAQRSLTIRIIFLQPVINEFRANKHNVRSGKAFKLRWDVKNASILKLYKNGEFYDTLENAAKDIELAEEAYDATEREIEYTLLASNGATQIKSAPVIIIVKPIGETPKYLKPLGIALLSLFALFILWLFVFPNLFKPIAISNNTDTSVANLPDTVKQRLGETSLPLFLNEIWQGNAGNQLININVPQQIIYYSNDGNNEYSINNIKEVYRDSTSGIYKLTVKTQQGDKLFKIRNITPQSFELSVCEDPEGLKCSEFNKMNLYYQDNPSLIYFPATNNPGDNNLQASQKIKLEKVTRNKKDTFLVSLFLADKFIQTPNINDIAAILNKGSIHYTITRENANQTAGNPFQRNYMSIIPKPVTSTASTETNTADCKRVFTSIAQTRNLASALIVCRLDLSGTSFTSIPAEVYTFTNLRELNLGSNKIDEDELTNLKKALPGCSIKQVITTNNGGIAKAKRSLGYIQFVDDNQLDEASKRLLRRIANQILADTSSKIMFYIKPVTNEEQKNKNSSRITPLVQYLEYLDISRNNQVSEELTYSKEEKGDQIHVIGINFPANF